MFVSQINFKFSRREAEQEERLEDWRKWQDKLDGFVDRVKRKLNEITEQDTPQDRNAIRELRDEATVSILVGKLDYLV